MSTDFPKAAGAATSFGTFGGTSFVTLSKPLSGDLPNSEHSILRSGSYLNGYTMCGAGYETSVYELIFVPWSFQALVLACFFVGSATGCTTVLWVAPLCLITMCGLALRHHQKHRNSGEVIVAALCLVAILFGTGVGVFGDIKWLSEYHRLSQGASYFQVLPRESAAGKMDAATIQFTRNATVDIQHGFGFTDARDPIASIYCVAPVINRNDPQTRIEYWAAGVNCCNSRGNFQCGAVVDAMAHDAVVLPAEMQNDYNFQAAIKGSSNANGYIVGNSYLLVNWTQNAAGFYANLWRSCAKMFMVFSGVYLLISVMVGVVLIQSFKGKQNQNQQNR